MIAIGIGDLHLTDSEGGGGLAKYISDPDAYVMRECTRVVRYASKKGITNIFLYGDICENPRMSYAAMEALIQFFRENSTINFYVILGNHDKFGNESSLGHSLQIIMLYPFTNVRFITEPEVIKIDGVKVNFQPWPGKSFSKNMLNVAHIEVNGSKLDSGRKFESDEFSNSKAVILMGHLHTNHKVRNTYYSGTLYQTYFGESLPKFFHLIDYSSPDEYEITNVPFDPEYKLFTCVVENKKDLKLISKDPKHLIKLVIQEGADVDPDSPECNLPNIVITKAFKTKSELTAILTEDLIHGAELEIKTEDYFNEWMAQRNLKPELAKRTLEVRSTVLGRRTTANVD